MLGAQGQSVFTDGVIATAAQTAEVSSCSVPVTESCKDHIVWIQALSTREDFLKNVLSVHELLPY